VGEVKRGGTSPKGRKKLRPDTPGLPDSRGGCPYMVHLFPQAELGWHVKNWRHIMRVLLGVPGKAVFTGVLD
jgi:hypothetical protein